MKYYKIKQQLKPLIIFSLQDLYRIDPDFRQSTLYNWEKAKKVVKLKKNSYIFSDFTPQDQDFYLISNRLYQPSYVSTELALNHYSIIPEAVSLITAVTTNKTQTFTTPIATFKYQTIQPDLLFGYDIIQVKNHGVMIASPEKTILDYLYLNTDIDSVTDYESLRWNKQVLKELIDIIKLNKYLAIFSNDALAQRVDVLQKYLKS